MEFGTFTTLTATDTIVDTLLLALSVSPSLYISFVLWFSGSRKFKT
jgi:hypothetical protein